MKPFQMALPKTVDAAVKASGPTYADSKHLAGGTDLLGELKEGTQQPKTVVNLKTIPGLAGMEWTERGFEIGALTKLVDIAEHDEVQAKWPALVQAIVKTATPQIRNMGTIGGNLCQRVRCWYYRDETYHCLKKGGYFCYAQQGENEYHAIFDNHICAAPHTSNSAPVFIAFDALFEITGSAGPRLVAAEKFFPFPLVDVTRENVLEPGEVLTKIILPKDSANRHSSYVEVRERQSFDWASANATANVKVKDGKIEAARIVLSAVAPAPQRREDLERMLVGQTLDDALLAKLRQQAIRGARPLEQNAYKLQLVQATVERALRRAVEGA